jgi:hypothetical protein
LASTIRHANSNRQKADYARSEAIREVCNDIMDANPGMAFATAYNLAMRKRPELFTDEAGRDPIQREDMRTEVAQKQQAIRDEIKKMREADPHLSFTLAWNRLMKQKTALFDFAEPKPRPKVAQPLQQPKPLTAIANRKLLIGRAKSGHRSGWLCNQTFPLAQRGSRKKNSLLPAIASQ